MERKKVNVILVEDSDTFAQALTFALQDAMCYEYRIKRMSIAAACILLGRRNDVDLVLLDLNMPPDFEDADAVVLVRATSKTVPIVVITGDATYNTAFAAGKAGALAYICKTGSTMDQIKNLIRDSYAALPAKTACAPVVEQIATVKTMLSAGESNPNLPPWDDADEIGPVQAEIDSFEVKNDATKTDPKPPPPLPPKEDKK